MKTFIIKEIEPNLELLSFHFHIKGFSYQTKETNRLKIKEMVIINPEIINGLIIYSFEKKYKKILEYYLKVLQEDDDGNTDTLLMLALDEIARLRSILIRKYDQFLKKEKEEQMLKKIKILENEIRMKIIDFKLIKEQELANTMNREEDKVIRH